jgi:hypothetical protein
MAKLIRDRSFCCGSEIFDFILMEQPKLLHEYLYASIVINALMGARYIELDTNFIDEKDKIVYRKIYNYRDMECLSYLRSDLCREHCLIGNINYNYIQRFLKVKPKDYDDNGSFYSKPRYKVNFFLVSRGGGIEVRIGKEQNFLFTNREHITKYFKKMLFLTKPFAYNELKLSRSQS